MQPHDSLVGSVAPGSEERAFFDPVQTMRRLARRLRRAARSERISIALPILRRLQAAKIFSEPRLSALFEGRRQIQRKHLLRLLAVEAGFADWERFSVVLPEAPAHALSDVDLIERSWMHANLWFASKNEARAHAAIHSGRVRRYGRHAVILNPDPQARAARMTESAP